MKTIYTFLAFWLISAGMLSAQQRGFKPVSVKIENSETTLYDQSHALVIGNSLYTNGWNSLPGVKTDITAVKTALENSGFNVVVKENLTKEQTDKAFSDFIASYGKGQNNRLLFYYAGHGFTVKSNYGDQLGYIVPVDAPNPNKDEAGFQSKAVEMAQIEIYAKRIDSKHALFLFDACFAGSLFALRDAVPAVINYQTREPVRQFITSGSADETVPDKSIFREQFVTALSTNDADANRDGYLTGTELGTYLQNQVINYSYENQHPQYGKIRHSALDKGDFVFVLGNAGTTVTPGVDEGKTNAATGTLTLISDYAGTAKITSAASGATLQSKAVSAGGTVTFSGLPAGIVVISITDSGGKQLWTSKVNIPSGGSTTIRAEKTTGTVQLVTDISGTLYVDGTHMRSVTAGNTYTVSDLAAGNRSLKITGSTPWEATVYVQAGQTATVRAEAPKGTLQLTSKVSGNFYIDEVMREYLSTGTRTYTDLAPGSHSAKIVSGGQTLWESSFTVSAGITSYLTAEQKPDNTAPEGFVLIKGGTFQMGSNDGESDEKPVRSVTVSDFYIGKYEVTQKEWRDIMGSNPSNFAGCDNCPVQQVSWDDIQTYLQKLNAKTGLKYRLPTEAEWEYAAGGGASGRTKWAGTDSESALGSYAWYNANAGNKTHPVGQKSPNKLGLYDLSGNVWEWCSDWYGAYPAGSQTNPQGATTGGHLPCVSGRQLDRQPEPLSSGGSSQLRPYES